MATRESPDVQALRKLHEAAQGFSRINRADVAIRISTLLRAIINEEWMDLGGVRTLIEEIMQEEERSSSWIVGRLPEAKTK